MRDDPVLLEAEFNKHVINYWLMSGLVVAALTIVGIPFGVLWYLIARPFCSRYLDRMSCTLTTRSLIIKKGWLNRIEKNVPLEKITDLALFQGPIMRAMKLQGFKVETAGSGGGASGGYLVQLTGIIDTEDFRDAVLAQRDKLSDRAEAVSAAPAPAPAGMDDSATAILRDIRETLGRIESRLPGPSDD